MEKVKGRQRGGKHGGRKRRNERGTTAKSFIKRLHFVPPFA